MISQTAHFKRKVGTGSVCFLAHCWGVGRGESLVRDHADRRCVACSHVSHSLHSLKGVIEGVIYGSISDVLRGILGV